MSDPLRSSQVELLAPAGGPEALRAAVACGADAVYLGVEQLNARRGAENFKLADLSEVCRMAHLRGVRVYLTLNVLVLPDELSESVELVDSAWVSGIDAVIVQDLGVLRVLRQALPHVRVHASTQLNAHSSDTVATLATRGVSRVTLARETSVGEIARLAEAGSRAGVEVESFVHGAICVCYSGQCLLSSLIGGRSANRGMCAQPCRLPYELVDEGGRVLGTEGVHLLSPKDLAGIGMLPEMVSTGVSALKIEGRMKSAEYVALVTGVYRAALDRAMEDPDVYAVTDGELSVLREAFSRGFTEGYLTEKRGNEMMSYRRPNNRGVLVGRVSSTGSSTATISFDVAVDAGDTIEVWTWRGRFAQAVGELEYEGSSHRSVPAGTSASIRTKEPASVGDRVFRVRNAALSAAAERVYAAGQTGAARELDVMVRVAIGEPLVVSVTDRDGLGASAEGPLVERARTKPVTAEEIIEHVGRFGGTGFEPREWDVALTPGAGVSYSMLHRVRREALEAYERLVLAPWSERVSVAERLPLLPPPARHLDPAPRLVASVANIATARACLQAGCESAYVPIEALDRDELPPGVVAALPRVCHDAEADSALSFVSSGARVLAGTLGLVSVAAERGARVEAHWSLNTTNAYSVAELAEIGGSFAWLSPELSSRQIAQVAAESVIPVGVAVFGRQEVMVTEHCVLMAEGQCAERCGSCKRRSGWRFLRDRKGYSFPVRTDGSGRSHIFNSVPLDLTAALPELLETGVSALRLDLETEPTNRAASHVARVRQALEDTLAGRQPGKTDRSKVTAGHFYRGVR